MQGYVTIIRFPLRLWHGVNQPRTGLFELHKTLSAAKTMLSVPSSMGGTARSRCIPTTGNKA